MGSCYLFIFINTLLEPKTVPSRAIVHPIVTTKFNLFILASSINMPLPSSYDHDRIDAIHTNQHIKFRMVISSQNLKIGRIEIYCMLLCVAKEMQKQFVMNFWSSLQRYINNLYMQHTYLWEALSLIVPIITNYQKLIIRKDNCRTVSSFAR